MQHTANKKYAAFFVHFISGQIMAENNKIRKKQYKTERLLLKR